MSTRISFPYPFEDGKLQVPSSMIPSVLHEYHDSPEFRRHYGFCRTYQKLSKRFTWPYSQTSSVRLGDAAGCLVFAILLAATHPPRAYLGARHVEHPLLWSFCLYTEVAAARRILCGRSGFVRGACCGAVNTATAGLSSQVRCGLDDCACMRRVGHWTMYGT